MKQWGTNGRFMLTICRMSSNSLPRNYVGEPYDFDARIRRFDGTTDGFRFAGFRYATWVGRSSAGTPCSRCR
jgi:hypothetical protein